MIKLVASACIETPAARVWDRLARLEDIQLWSDAVVHARCEGALARGVGAGRTYELVGNRTITERWVAWDAGRSFQYKGVVLPLDNRAVYRWSVLPRGERSLLTSEAEVEFKGGASGWALALALAPVMRRMAPRRSPASNTSSSMDAPSMGTSRRFRTLRCPARVYAFSAQGDLRAQPRRAARANHRAWRAPSGAPT
jgi:hypothetical protein